MSSIRKAVVPRQPHAEGRVASPPQPGAFSSWELGGEQGSFCFGRGWWGGMGKGSASWGSQGVLGEA